MQGHEELISPWRYLLSHAIHNFTHREHHQCLGICQQPHSQSQGLLIPLNDLDLASQKKPTSPSCVLGSLELLEVAPGGGCGGGSADSWLCSVRGPWQHFSPPFTKAWLWHTPGGDPLLVHPIPRWECCPVRS